jgi:adenylate cyclase
MGGKRDPTWDRGRFDIIQQVVAFDEETGHFEMRVEPDPLRYEWQELEGERVLYDRYDRTTFPHALVMSMLREAMAMPRPSPLPILADVGRYIAERRPLIGAALDGAEVTGDRVDASDELLASFAGDQLEFVVMSIDIVGSSAISNTLSSTVLARVLPVFLTEVAEVVALFHGHVLRYAGDGLVSYFPEPGFITKNDLAVDCALCLRRFVREAVGPELLSRDLAPVEVRIGLDAGEAAVRVLGSPRTKRHADIIGDVVSLACNIEAVAAPGEVLIGAIVERNLHVTWRQQCEAAEPPPDWSLYGADGKLYGLHRLREGAERPIEGPQRTRANPTDDG